MDNSTSSVCLWHLWQWEQTDRIMVECTLSITHCLRLNLQLHTIDLVRTCRVSSFCTVAWQLARFQLTRRIARSLGDSWASCASIALFVQPVRYYSWFDCGIVFFFPAGHLCMLALYKNRCDFPILLLAQFSATTSFVWDSLTIYSCELYNLCQ